MDTKTQTQDPVVAAFAARREAAKKHRAEVLAMYEGDGTEGSAMTLQQIANHFKLTRQRAHQMVSQARTERKEAQLQNQ